MTKQVVLVHRSVSTRWSSIIIVAIMPLLFSCVNKIEDIERVANIKDEVAVDVSKNIEIIVSDSAIVKAVLTAPEMLVYHDSTENYEFPKSVKIIFYDKNIKEAQRITADYGIQRTKDQLTEFRKNVVVHLANGSIVKTEELFYDEKNKKYYNTVPVTFLMNDSRGNLYANYFTSDVNFDRIEGESMTGYIIPKKTPMFPSSGF